MKQREDWLSSRIDKARDDKSIDGHKADRARHELDSIRHDESHSRVRHDGGQLTDTETQELEARSTSSPPPFIGCTRTASSAPGET